MLSHEEGPGQLGRVSTEDSREQDPRGTGGTGRGQGLAMGVSWLTLQDVSSVLFVHR